MICYKISRKDFKNSVESARHVSVLTGKSIMYHWIDCIFCCAIYGCGPSQYYEGGFYKLRSFDREKTYTKYRGYKLKRLFNNSSYEYICMNKVEFNKYFSKYIGRNYIYCKEATQQEILSFLEENRRVIVKPINLTKGEGVFELDRTKKDNELVLSVLGQEFLLEEFIMQHPMCALVTNL